MSWDSTKTSADKVLSADWNNMVSDQKGRIAKTTNITALNETGIADGEIAVFNLSSKDIRTSDKTFEATLTNDDTKVCTSGGLTTALGAKAPATHYGYISRQAGGFSLPDTNPANYATNILPTNGFPEISVGFTGDDEQAYDVVLMPRDWTGGTGAGAVTIIIEFSTTSSATDKGAKFEVWGKRIAAGVVNTTALDLLATTALALNGGANFNNNTVEINLGAMAGAGRKIQLMFKRDKTGESTDTIAAEVKITAYELRYIKTPAA